MTEISLYIYAKLSSILGPVCQANGISLKTMPDDADVGVVRTAMAVMFVPSLAVQSGTQATDFAARRVGSLNIKAYVLALAASQVGIGSAAWVTEVLVPVLSRARVDLLTVQVDGVASSFKEGIWQYRIELTLSMPYVSANVEIEQDTQQLNGDLGSSIEW